MTLYIAKITENISVIVLSFCATYIKQAAHLCFGHNVKSQSNRMGRLVETLNTQKMVLGIVL